MNINFDIIGNNENVDNIISPNELFRILPEKSDEYKYLRDVQSEVLKEWYDVRNNKDSIIKMNTGSGKTIVGLLILKSSINETGKNAVYVVPDNLLVEQVVEESKKLGIRVTKDPESLEFKRGKSVLVINIHTLVNGKSKFGMRSHGDNIDIGTIIIDDVHACLKTTESQFMITIDNDDIKYRKLFDIFQEDLYKQNNVFAKEIVDGVSNSIMQIPFWSWNDKIGEVIDVLHNGRDDKDILFSWPLLKENIKLCNCVITSNEIEITPKSIPIEKITSFVDATRRIFMSATLSDDSTLVSHFDVDYEKITSVICPENANDIGERMIIIPQSINGDLGDGDIAMKIKTFSEKHNVVVIVPSYNRAKEWEKIADLVLDNTNISKGVQKLKEEKHVGLVILVNRYDGIDLPDDSCRLLVLDGVPDIRRQYDILEDSALKGSERISHQQIQNIEQGMGRSVRSNTDYSAVILMGKKLVDRLYGDNAINHFSDATKKQIQLSEKVTDQIAGEDIDTIFGIIDYCINREKGWVSANKNALLHAKYDKRLKISDITILNKIISQNLKVEDFQEARKRLSDFINDIENDREKGWYMQQLAEVVHNINPIDAQKILKSAKRKNVQILKPIDGIDYDKKLNRFHGQANQLVNFLQNEKIDENKYIIKIDSVLEDLVFEKKTSKRFEHAFKEIANLLGFSARNPEEEYGKGPDVLWRIGELNFIVIECKNESETEYISKSDCNQLNGSIEWFKDLYDENSCVSTPVMVHKSVVFDFEASPNPSIKIVNESNLKSFKDSINKFSRDFVKDGNFTNVLKIQELLEYYNLTGDKIIDKYTVTHKRKR